MGQRGKEGKDVSHCTGGNTPVSTTSAGSAADGVAVATGTSEVLDVATNDWSVVVTVKVVGWAEMAGLVATDSEPEFELVAVEARLLMIEVAAVAAVAWLLADVKLEAEAEIREGATLGVWESAVLANRERVRALTSMVSRLSGLSIEVGGWSSLSIRGGKMSWYGLLQVWSCLYIYTKLVELTVPPACT